MAVKLPESINLEIVTPDRQLFCGEVDSVTVPGANGYLGILPGHAALLSELRAGIISFRSGSRETRLFCGWGFVEVLSDRVSVLAERVERPEEIDVDQARLDREDAEMTLRSRSPDVDFAAAVELWESAVARLGVAGSNSR